MFKKEKLKVAKVDLDNDLEIPEFDFDAPPPKDDRKPVKKILDGLISGAKSTLFSRDLLEKTVRKALPDGFGEAIDMASTVSGEARKIYGNAVNQIKPSVNEMARAANKLAPAEKVKTKVALDTVEKWSKNNSEKYSSNDKDSQREAGLNLSLNEVFKFQAEQSIRATADQNIKDKVQTGLEIIRHKDNFGLLNNISLNTSRLSQYQEKITAAFQKKSLEIQYRNYFVAIDALEESKRQNATTKLLLENIQKNTALPEIVKTTNHESYKINARNKFWSSVNEGLFSGRNNIIGKISENIGRTVREKISSATEAFSMATMAMDGVAQQQEMAADFGENAQSGGELAGNMAGGMGVDWLASKFGGWINKQANKNKKIGSLGRKVGSFVSNAPQHLNEFKKSSQGEWDNESDSKLKKVGNFFLRVFKTVIPNMGIDTAVESDKADSLTAPFNFTKQTHKSINEVIPGFLSRIFRELQVLRTGDTKIGLSTYDFTKNKFSSFAEVKTSILSRVTGNNDDGLKYLVDKINSDNKLSSEAKKALIKRLKKDKNSGRKTTVKDLTRENSYRNDPELSRYSSEIITAVKDHFRLDKDGNAKDANDFDTKERLENFNREIESSDGTITQGQLKDFFKLIDPDGTKLDTKARDVLGKKLLSGNFDTRLGSAKRFVNKDTFNDENTKQYAELFTSVFKQYFKTNDKGELLDKNNLDDKDKETTLNRKYNDLGKSISDSRGFIQNLINLGQYDLLKSVGLINDKGSEINLKKIQLLNLGEHSDISDDDLLPSNAQNNTFDLTPLIEVNKTGFEKLIEKLETINTTIKDGTVSDMTAKKDFKPVPGNYALNAIRNTPVTNWNYKDGKGDGGNHIGPMAQTVNKTMGEDAAPGGKKIDLITMNGMTMSAIQELDKKQQDLNKNYSINTEGKDKSESLIDTIINTNKLTIDKLEEIKETIINTGGTGGGVGKGFDTRTLLGSLKGFAKSSMDAGRNLISGGHKLSKGLIDTIPFGRIKETLEVAGKGLKTGAEFGFDKLRNLTKIRDVFIQGETDPRIEEIKLRTGKYFLEDENGNRTILKDISGITGKIVDEFGKTVIAVDELGKMFTKNIKGKGFVKFVTKVGKFVTDKGNAFSKYMLGLIPPALKSIGAFAKSAKNKLFDMLDEPVDIYVPGIKLPVMSALVMRNGGYTSAKTGKVIFHPSEIDGEVLFKGDVVLTIEDIKKGIFDKNGKAIKTPIQKIKDFALNNIKKTIEFGKKVSFQAIGGVKKGLNYLTGLVKGGASGIKNGINNTTDYISGVDNNNTLIQIRDLLNTRLPGKRTKFVDKFRNTSTKVDSIGLAIFEKIAAAKEKVKEALLKKKFNDADGDGNREGSWRSMGKKVKDKATDIKDNIKNKITEKLGGDKPGIVSKLINKMFGIKDKEEVAEDSLDELKDIKNILLAQSAGSVLGGGGSDLPIGDGPGGKRKGRIGRAVGKLGGAKKLLSYGGKALGVAGAAYGAYSAYDNISKGNYGAAAMDGAMAVGSGALAYGGLGALGNVAGAAGGALLTGAGAILASPVLLGVAAGAIGYLGYKYLTRNSANKLELVRYVQYGFHSDKTDNVSKVFGLEDVLVDKHVSYENGTAVLKDKDFDIEKALGMFGIKKEETNEVRKWTYWFQNRFKPVFLTHLTALYGVNPKVKLADINSMTPEEKDKYLKAASFKEGPYDQNASPDRNLINLPSNGKDVSNTIAIAQKEIDKDLKKDSKKDKSALNATGVVTAAQSLDTSKETILDKDGKKIEPIKPFEEIKKPENNKAPLLAMIAATGAVIGGPVVIGGLALGAAALLGYKFYNSGKVSKLTKLRLVQYGFFPEQKDAINLVMTLENNVIKNISFSAGVAKFNDKDFNPSEALSLFGISTTDEKSYNDWVSWFTGRFKPVFLTHVTALNIANEKFKLSEVDDLVPNEKLKYLNLVKFDDGPYDITNSPVSSIKELTITSKDITQAFELAKEEVEKESKTDNKTLMSAFKNDVKNLLNPNRVQDAQPGQTNVGDDIKKSNGVLSFLADKFTNAITTPLMAVGAAVGKFFGFNASVLETIRFKTYGLKTLERSKVASLRTLEEVVFKNVTFSSTGTAEWSSTAEVIIRYVGKDFGVESPSSENAKDWINWFVKRFLPVYLAYLGLLKQATGKEKQSAAESSLKSSQELEIATKISAINGVWSIISSPWSGYVLSTDIKEISENLALLREKSSKDELVDAKKSATTLSNQDKVKESTVKKTIESKGSVDGETPPKEVASSNSGSVSGSVPKSAGGPLSSGAYASQYIKLGPGVSLDGLNPEMKKNFFGMVEEYGTLTGKSLYVNSGSRTHEQQAALYKKDPKKAAPPGSSLHEFGLAIDASSVQLDELDKLGLMRKYGFTRPVGGETWHMEPAGIQQNIQDAKNDEFFATNAIKASLGRGGAGFGSIKGTALAKRNSELAKQIFGDGSSDTIQTADATKPTVQAGGEVVAGSKTEDNQSVVSSGKGYANSANKTTIASLDSESSKADDFKAAVPGSGSGVKGVPNAKPGTGLNSVRETIEGAAKVTGVDPNLMLGIAGMESSFDPNAKAKTSSASGLYQFVSDTWSEMISKHGKKYGLDANSSPMDAKANALMGGEFLKANIKSIANSKPNPTNTDLYLAHFLGAGGARKFFAASADEIGAKILPAAAKANKSIFYNGSTPRTVSEIYSLMDNKVNTTLSGLGLSVSKSGLGFKPGGGEGLKANSFSNQSSPSIPNTSNEVSAIDSLNSNEGIIEPTKSENKSFSKIVTQQPNNLMGFNSDQSNQPQQDNRYDMNKALSSVGDTLKESLAVQTNMYSVLKDILKSVNPTAIANAMKNDVAKSEESNPSTNNVNNSQRSNIAQSGPRATKTVPVPMSRLSI